MKTFYYSLVVDHYKIKIWRRLPLMITVGRWPKTSTPKEIFSTMSKNTLKKFLCVLSTHLFGKGGPENQFNTKKDWLPIFLNATILRNFVRQVKRAFKNFHFSTIPNATNVIKHLTIQTVLNNTCILMHKA